MDQSIQLWLLGVPRAENAGQPITRFESRKAVALLGYLAARAEAVTRSELAALFWPDQTDERGRANLRHLLHTLSAQLPGSLATDRQSVRLLGAPACWCDTRAFDQFVMQGTLASLGAAVELYRGAFLDGITLDDCPDVETWLTQERERWHERVALVLADLVTRSRERQEWVAGLRAVDRLLALDPWREAAHQDKMRLLALSGQRDSAMAQYEACRRVLADELGLDPAPETTALYEQIRDGVLALPTTPVAFRGQVPLPPTPLLGRAAEVAQLAALVAQPTCRLLTLVGPGGVGKTRLSLELATHLQAHFDDGAYVVELAAIQDPALVAPTIAQTLGILEQGERAAAERLKGWLGDKHLLLVLDNFEQVLPAAALVRDLLASTPRLTVLVTSRIPLHLRGEQEFPVGPLALPDLDAFTHPMADAAGLVDAHAATALFVARARSVNPQFVVTPADAPLIAAICTRLDGLPLAIELAAARSKLFAPSALLARLERRLPLLRSTTRDRHPHQQTIRDTIAWSYGLLTPDDQQVFARLAVFVGGWTQEMAEAIVVLEDAHEVLDVIEAIARLVDQNLVRQQAGPNDEPRFSMLETIREYALEHLARDAHADALRRHHATRFAEFAEANRLMLRGPQQVDALDRMEAEHDNLRAALAYALAERDEPLALHLGGTLAPFWQMHAHLAEGIGWLTRILAIAKRDISDAYLTALYGICILMEFRDTITQRLAFSQELSALAHERDDKRWMAMALAAASQHQADPNERLANYQAARTLFAEVGDQIREANILLNMGRTLVFLAPDPERATSYLEESLQLSDALGDATGSMQVRLHLGMVAMQGGDLAAAVMQYQTALRLAWAIKNRVMVAYCFEALGGAALMGGAVPQAVEFFSVGERMRTRLGAYRMDQEDAIYQHWLAAAHARLGAATFDAAWAEGQARSLEQALERGLSLALPISEAT